MKASTYLTILCLAFLTLASCSKYTMTDLSKDIPFSITMPETSVEYGDTDGSAVTPEFTTAFFQTDPEVKGCLWFSAHTNGRMVYNSIFLSMYLKEKSLVVGKEPVMEKFSFSLPFSSDSRDYAGFGKGHIYVKEIRNDLIVLRFDNAVFELGRGTYRLNGDLAYTPKGSLD